MSELKELTYKDISYIRAAIEGFIGQLKMDLKSDELDDERLNTQENILYYEKLLYTFQKAEKQAVGLRLVIRQRDGSER